MTAPNDLFVSNYNFNELSHCKLNQKRIRSFVVVASSDNRNTGSKKNGTHFLIPPIRELPTNFSSLNPMC